MTERQWLPHEYQDEVVPPQRPAPNDWIIKLPDGSPALDSADTLDVVRLLHEGDRILFDWCERYEDRQLTLTLEEDGTWTHAFDRPVPIPPPDGELTVCAMGDWETAMPSVDEFVEEYIANGAIEGETLAVSFFAWSVQPVAFRYQDGAFHREPLEEG